MGSQSAKLGEAGWEYAVTGAVAAQRFEPVAPARQAKVYVVDSAQAASALNLKPADAGANVLLAEPYDNAVFERAAVRDGLRTVSPSQLAAYLLTGSGCEPSEGEELLGWMRRNEDEWRT